MSTKIQEPNFSLELPASFLLRRDGEHLNCVCSEPPGVLTIIDEVVENPDDLPNLSRMLAGFLTRNGHPVATDELLPVRCAEDAQGFSWQYVEDDKYFRFWLFGTLQCWVLLTFVCPQSSRAELHSILESSLKTLQLRTDDTSAP